MTVPAADLRGASPCRLPARGWGGTTLAQLDERGISTALGDIASDTRRIAVGMIGSLFHRNRREDLLARVLLLAILAALTLLVLDVRRADLATPVLAPAALAALTLGAGLWGWREWRGSPAGRAHLLFGGLGALAALTLGRAWVGGDPGRLWILTWFLAPSALIETTLIAIHGGGEASLPPVRRALLYGAPLLLYGLLTFAGDRSPFTITDQTVAAGLLAAGLLAGLVRCLAALRLSRAIDARQRGKLLAAGEGVALASLLAVILGHLSGRYPAAFPLLGLTAAPAALCLAAIEGNLLWVDRVLRRALTACLAVPSVAFVAWLAVKWGGVAGTAVSTILVLSAPYAWRRLGGAVERLTLRSRARRRSALGMLEGRLDEASTLEEVSAVVGAIYREAFPRVKASLLIGHLGGGDFVEVIPAGPRGPAEEDVPLRSLEADHPLVGHLRATIGPLTRYDILTTSSFAGKRGTWLGELDAMHAAALVPCRDRDALRGVLLLGAQVRGGFFTEDEIRDACTVASPIGPALTHALALAQARAHITKLDGALETARSEVGRVRAEEYRSMEDLEESTRHVMAAYTELKVRGMEAREVRARLAASAGVILAGRVLALETDQIAAALSGVSGGAGRHKSPRRGKARPKQLERARLGFEAIRAVAEKDPTTPCDLSRAVQTALAALETGWGGRISVDCKIEDIPLVVWPRGALQAALLALLVNAGEAIEKRGTITVGSRALKGRVLTVADAEGAGDGEEVPVGNTPGQLAWISGAPRAEFTVSDNGCGIPEEDQGRLFTPFFTTKPARPGSLGLGLSIVADALARHGGSIRIESDPGRGSSFVLELPGVRPKGRSGRSRPAP